MIYIFLFIYGYILQYFLYKFMESKGYRYKKSKLHYVCAFSGIMMIVLFLSKINKATHLYYFILSSLIFIILIYMSIIDWEQHIAPDLLNIMLFIMGVVNLIGNYTPHNFKQMIFGFIFAGGLFYLLAVVSEFILKILRSENTMGLGGGDIKLMACLGLIFGFYDVLMILILVPILSIIPSIFLIIKEKSLNVTAALTPYINMATMIIVLCGKSWI